MGDDELVDPMNGQRLDNIVAANQNQQARGKGFALDDEEEVGATEIGLEEEVKERFWEDLDEVVRSVPNVEKIVIAGDFNGHIGVLPEGYDDVHGDFGFDVRNGEGTDLLNFARAFELVVVNSSFPKEDHLIIFRRELEHLEESHDFSYCRRFKVEEVKEAICKMRKGRAMGLDEISVDF
ncbi:craniofacial development protein 2-like [Capsicum annuum]|uniref:craniofacial development protein 2-like n=1 Tax=Capsicum annuum TaxID=4072 RepID=UPI001FB05B75|nr:craniofacial development protein 2-like [Capsicum annuum]